MTTFTITTGARRGDYVLRDAAGRSRGLLRAGWTLRRVRIETTDGRFSVRRHGWEQLEVAVGDELVASFGPDHVTVPGPGPQPTWSAARERGGWHGTLRRGAAQVDVRLSAPRARRGQVDVRGDWEQLDLVVLAVCFALVLRRRRRVAVVAGGT